MIRIEYNFSTNPENFCQFFIIFDKNDFFLITVRFRKKFEFSAFINNAKQPSHLCFRFQTKQKVYESKSETTEALKIEFIKNDKFEKIDYFIFTLLSS